MSAVDIKSKLDQISNAIENIEEEEEKISEHLNKSLSNTFRSHSPVSQAKRKNAWAFGRSQSHRKSSIRNKGI